MSGHNYFVYITSNPKKTTLYIGVTNELTRRMDEHVLNAGVPTSFAGRYYCFNLVYYERFTYVQHAIEREKQLKKWSRKKKDELIRDFNPEWKPLNDEVKDWED
ncbi:GIY-YIG nuclease family protein [Pontibacter sp. BAB1700]|uniref:Putative endonuclease n=1 Tax=Pontibacter lucknowensis TaxID=1077936 RepID=A0A1N6Y5J3_9BACT|nr:GIY-YIG nuclease family protein [Pontibacter sp. BAB1700]EJF08268.1 excinuclease ABC subunit C [Pontibacter sp. BAB1700]SIR09902.1 putative endonuclease [Pontibacter lucknowensis]